MTKRVLVLGGSGHVGQALCRRLAADGARLAFTYRSGEDAAVALAEETGGLALPLDVTSVEDLRATTDRAAAALGGLDALVNCAAVGVTGDDPRGHPPIGDISEAAWDQMLDVNAKASFFAAQAFLEHAPPAGEPRPAAANIVFLGSVDGVKPVPGPIHYATSKGALTTLARALAKELGPRRVCVNVIAPGVLEGGVSQTLPQQLKDEYLKHSGLGRFGTYEEVARITAWFALENTYVTGQSVLLDGGL